LKPQNTHQRVLTILGFGTAISLLGDATLYTVLPHPSIASQVGVSLGMVGVLLGINRATRLVLNSPVGLLYDRLPRRPLLIASLVLGSISSLIYALGTGFWPLFSGRVSWGFAWALLWVGGNTVVLDISTDENRGKYSGKYQMWFTSGVAVSSFIGGVFTDLVGFRMGQWLSATLIGVGALLWFFFLPETRPDHGSKPRSEPHNGIRRSFPWRLVFGPSLFMFAVRFVSWGVLAATAILWLSSHIGEGLRFSNQLIPIATLTGAYTASSMLISIGCAPATGYLSDKLGRRWPIIALTLLIGGIGIWLMSEQSMIVALIGAFLAPITGTSVETLIPAIAGDRIEKAAHGRALGLIYTVADLGSTLGPPAALGILNAGIFPLPVLYKISAVLLALLAPIALLQIRSRPSGRTIRKL
jgi:MFS family permease